MPLNLDGRLSTAPQKSTTDPDPASAALQDGDNSRYTLAQKGQATPAHHRSPIKLASCLPTSTGNALVHFARTVDSSALEAAAQTA